MSTTPVTIQFPVSGTDCGWIATTAAEGGIGYWSQIESYEFERWWPKLGEEDPLDVDDDFIFYVLREEDDNGDWLGDRHEVTPVVIRRGIQLVNQGVEGNFQARQLLDFDGVDADQADWIIQLGLFGKLVYG